MWFIGLGLVSNDLSELFLLKTRTGIRQSRGRCENTRVGDITGGVSDSGGFDSGVLGRGTRFGATAVATER